MKKLTLCRLFFAAAATILSIETASAQFLYAANRDHVAGPGNGATNLGNAFVHFRNGEMKAMVWDGSSPTLAWNYNGSTGTTSLAGTTLGLGAVTDPDIVLNPTGNGEYALITYLVGNQVYYEVQEYDYGTKAFVLSSGPTKVNAGAEPCSSPNVDVNDKGIAVLVYAQIDPTITSNPSKVVARTTDLNGGGSSLTPTYDYVAVTGFTAFKALKPDVAVFRDQVTVVYIQDYYGTNQDVVIQYDDLNIVDDGGNSGNTTADHSYTTPTASDVVGAPRIAGPSNSALHDRDFEAVVQVNDDIIGLNKHFASNPTAMTSRILTSSPTLNNTCDVQLPVVTYTNDNIIVAFGYSDCNLTTNINKEVLARQLTFGGVPMTDGYSVVNYERRDGQWYPAVDGRYHNMDVLYTFHADPNEDILYKSSLFSNEYLRVRPAVANPSANAGKTSLGVYPNPVARNANVQVMLAADETATALEVYNVTGQRVADLGVKDLKTGANTLTWNSEKAKLPAGMYTFKLTTSLSSYVLKVQKN